MAKSEKRVAREMRSKGYKYIILVPNEDALYAKTANQAAEYARTITSEERVDIKNIDDYLGDRNHRRRNPKDTRTTQQIMDQYLFQRRRNPVDSEIHAAMARAFFVSSWADYEEEHGRTYPGEELMDVAPETSEEAYRVATKLYTEIERENNIDLEDFIPPGEDEAYDQEEFGHYLAMEAMGHGVGWSDDHEDHGLKVPDMEFYYEEDDDFEDNPTNPEPLTTVSFWFDKDYFTISDAKRWLRKYDEYNRYQKSDYYSTDNFYSFPQISRAAEKKHKGHIRSKYLSKGVMLKHIPARFL